MLILLIFVKAGYHSKFIVNIDVLKLCLLNIPQEKSLVGISWGNEQAMQQLLAFNPPLRERNVHILSNVESLVM